jgi:hypothetical protein
LIAAESVSASSNQVFRVPLVDVGAQHSSSGKYPWSIDSSSSTFVYLKNATDHSQQYNLQVNYAGGSYALGLKTLSAGQAATVDVRKLRDDKIPDIHGNLLPANASGGQIIWSVYGAENRVIVGRAEQTDIVHGMSMTAACPTCCPNSFSYAYIDPAGVTGLVGDFTLFRAYERDQDCYGNYLDPFSPAAQWWSSDTSVATCDGNGGATAVGPGSTFINAYWFAPSWYQLYEECEYAPIDNTSSATCDVPSVRWSTPGGVGQNGGGVPMSNGTPPQGSPAFINTTTITATGTPSGGSYSWSTSSNKVTLSNPSSATVTVTAQTESQNTADVSISLTYTLNGKSVTEQVPFTVQKPTFMDYVSTDNSGAASCPSGQSGPYKDITWQLADKNHNPIKFAIPTYDTLTNNTPNSCGVPAAGGGTPPGSTTGAGGRWGHHYALCSTACQSGGRSCSVTGTQKYFANGFEIDKSYTMSCASITVDGH